MKRRLPHCDLNTILVIVVIESLKCTLLSLPPALPSPLQDRCRGKETEDNVKQSVLSGLAQPSDLLKAEWFMDISSPNQTDMPWIATHLDSSERVSYRNVT